MHDAPYPSHAPLHLRSPPRPRSMSTSNISRVSEDFYPLIFASHWAHIANVSGCGGLQPRTGVLCLLAAAGCAGA